MPLTPLILTLPGVAVLAIFVVIPLIGMVRVTFGHPPFGTGLTLASYRVVFADTFYLSVLLRTALMAVLATACCLVIGYPLALFFSFGSARGNRFLLLAVLSPLFVSVVVRSYALQLLFGPASPWNRFLAEPINLQFTPTAVVIGLVYTLLPFMVLSIVAGLNNVDRNVLAAARSLGAGFLSTLWRVILPLSAAGIFSGCLIVFTLSMTAVALPLLLGGASFKTLGSLVYQQILQLFNWPTAYILGLILLIFNGLVFFVFRRFSGESSSPLPQ